jgi:hypothetical protein
MKYCSEVSYNPKTDGTLEKFIGNITYVFSQLAIANNELNENMKLGMIRNALKRGSNKYNAVLDMCKFSEKHLSETMQKLHDLESEEKVNNITHKSRKVEYEK